jgi:hypothetical protein
MTRIRSHPLPAHALLVKYGRDGGYADCFVTDVPRVVAHADFVAAFYTTWLFKFERFILRWLVGKPSTDAEARSLARGKRDTFAAWSVEGRQDEQLLLCDFQSRTRSWLMVEAGAASTRLYFGSGIVPRVDRLTGAKRLGPGFRALLGFHRLYSRALLATARSRLALSRHS